MCVAHRRTRCINETPTINEAQKTKKKHSAFPGKSYCCAKATVKRTQKYKNVQEYDSRKRSSSARKRVLYETLM